MRETNLNRNIKRTDVKVGDKIRVSREVVVTAVRETELYDGVGQPRRPITVVNTSKDSMAITSDESIVLLERDKESVIKIPAHATHVFWQDTDDYDYYARRDESTGKWVTAGDPGVAYATNDLIESIEDGEYDTYKDGSFEVLKYKGWALGGRIQAPSFGEGLTTISQNILPARLSSPSGMLG